MALEREFLHEDDVLREDADHQRVRKIFVFRWRSNRIVFCMQRPSIMNADSTHFPDADDGKSVIRADSSGAIQHFLNRTKTIASGALKKLKPTNRNAILIRDERLVHNSRGGSLEIAVKLSRLTMSSDVVNV
ncbi:MAG TPA: hypothetical protein VEU47_04030 [Candidatus Cybelea sp.]|nr:hypothetical protein [Candidatus Cybelea sp.]